MKINKKYKRLEVFEHGYKIVGSVESKESIYIKLDRPLFVVGDLKSGGSIKSNTDIICNGDIIATKSVVSRGYMISGGRIQAGKNIKSGKTIKADGSLRAGKNITAGESIILEGVLEAGGNIKVEESIEASKDIISGGSVEAGKTVSCSRVIYKTKLDVGLSIVVGINRNQGTDQVETEIINKSHNRLIDAGPEQPYRINGSIKSDESLHIDLDKPLYVSGDIIIGGELISTERVEAGGDIKTYGSIEFGGKIVPYEDIKAGGIVTTSHKTKFTRM